MSDQDMTRSDRDKVLAGEYALGLLPDDEAENFAARLKSEPELRALYTQWAEDFAALADEVKPIDPPGSVKRKIEAELFAGGETSFLSRLRRGWLLGGLAAALLLLVVFAGLFDLGSNAPQNPAYIAEITAEDGSLIVAASYDAARNTLYTERRKGEAPPGRVLELWLIAGDNPPVSLGVLPAGSTGEFTLEPALQAGLDQGVLAITDEPPGGAPNGVATGAVLAVGPVTKT